MLGQSRSMPVFGHSALPLLSLNEPRLYVRRITPVVAADHRFLSTIRRAYQTLA